MVAGKEKVHSILSGLKTRTTPERLVGRLSPKDAQQKQLKPAIRPTKRASARSLESNWRTLLEHTAARKEDKGIIADRQTIGHLESYNKNIESCIGSLKIPLGVIGPIRVNGLFAQDDYYVPLATTEAALVASYARGARLINAAGGCTAVLLNSGLSRTPGFVFDAIPQMGLFINWVYSNYAKLKRAAESTSRHCRLIDMQTHVEGNHAYFVCEYKTGDASGQNMVTIATENLCKFVAEHSPIKPKYWVVESNFSGDKKASAMSFTNVRGKKVVAEALLPLSLVKRHLHVDAKRIHEVWLMSALGAVMSGTIGVQAHYANGLAALYLACGQDVACVSESSVGITRMQVEDGHLYVSVTLPNVMVGTVGGGTGLPAQSAGLKILGLAGAGHSSALAEVCAAVCLAGEVSITGAISAGDFASAHRKLAR